MTERLSFMPPVSRPSPDRVLRGGPSRWLHRRATEPITIFAAPRCTFSSVSALKKTVLTVAAASLLPAFFVAPATADTADGKADKKQPNPPAAMSTVGGAQLGKAGTQVSLGPGAPCAAQGSDRPVVDRRGRGER